jgi:hypothetical protein
MTLRKVGQVRPDSSTIYITLLSAFQSRITCLRVSCNADFESVRICFHAKCPPASLRSNNGNPQRILEVSEMFDFAPEAPETGARWAPSAKNDIGTTPPKKSPVWFTVSHGILNEIYFPRIDSACTRDLGFVVAGPDGYFSEEKRDCVHVTNSSIPVDGLLGLNRALSL